MLTNTTINQDHQDLPTEIEQQDDRKNWINYLKRGATSVKDMSKSQLFQYKHVEKMDSYKNNGMHLFHMTITYIPYNDIQYQPRDVNGFFTKFYTRAFLPFLLQERRIERVRELQPICYSFLDEHENKPAVGKFHKISGTNDVTPRWYPVRLHHHAVLAVHPDTLGRMESLIGENTLCNIHTNTTYTHKILTTDLKPCTAMCLLYASKKLYQYPDFLQFPDSYTKRKKSPCGKNSSLYSATTKHC